MDSLTITILKYKEYKGRSDVKNNSWFRLSNRFLEDADFYDFTAEEKLVWIYFLSISSQKNAAKVSISFRHAERVCGLKRNVCVTAIEKLLKIKVISTDVSDAVHGRNVIVTDACATDRQTNKQTEQTIQDRQDDPAAPAAEADPEISDPEPDVDLKPAKSGRFEIIQELQDDRINEVLHLIAPTTQKRWLRDYKSATWLKDSINETITFYSARGDDLTGKWGVTLHQSLKRAKIKAQRLKQWPPIDLSALADEYKLEGGDDEIPWSDE